MIFFKTSIFAMFVCILFHTTNIKSEWFSAYKDTQAQNVITEYILFAFRYIQDNSGHLSNEARQQVMIDVIENYRVAIYKDQAPLQPIRIALGIAGILLSVAWLKRAYSKIRALQAQDTMEESAQPLYRKLLAIVLPIIGGACSAYVVIKQYLDHGIASRLIKLSEDKEKFLAPWTEYINDQSRIS